MARPIECEKKSNLIKILDNHRQKETKKLTLSKEREKEGEVRERGERR